MRACHDKNIWRAGSSRPPDCPCRNSSAWRSTSRRIAAARRAPYPCVLKPLGLSASRGVIRANDPDEFRGRLSAHPDAARKERSRPAASICRWRLHSGPRIRRGRHRHARRAAHLAIFDKPDPLEGPFFEETIYVTPSRESAAVQQRMREAVERAVRALGLYHGPFHAELRSTSSGVWMLEVAARPIGGLCSKALRFGGGMPLEELLLRHAIGEDVSRTGAGRGGVRRDDDSDSARRRLRRCRGPRRSPRRARAWTM